MLSLYLICQILLPLHYGAHLKLGILRRKLTQFHIVLSLDVSAESFRICKARTFDTGSRCDISRRDHSHIRGTSADIHHHMSHSLHDIHSGSDGSCYGGLQNENLLCTRADYRILHGTPLHLGDTRRRTHTDIGTSPDLSLLQGILNKCLDHPFRQRVIGNDTAGQRRLHIDPLRRLTHHTLGFGAYRYDLFFLRLISHNRRLVDHDPLISHVDTHI